jgi:hypothetical protein
MGLRSIDQPRFALFPFLDVTFPTAENQTLGSGKYQLGPGVRLAFPINSEFGVWVNARQLQFQVQLQEVFSVAGDDKRRSINVTKLEFGLEAALGERYWMKLEPKFTQDWIQDKFGAVLEIEAGWHITRHWNAWIKPGVGTNGSRAAGVYDELLQVGVRYVF